MQLDPSFGFEQIATEIIRGVVATVADQPHWSEERRAVAQHATVCTVMAFNPRDPVETMMAGQCLVYDAMLREGARDMLRGQAEEVKLRARPGILGAGKMFLASVRELNRMQGRAADRLAFAAKPHSRPIQTENPAPAETPVTTTQPAVEADADQTAVPPAPMIADAPDPGLATPIAATTSFEAIPPDAAEPNSQWDIRGASAWAMPGARAPLHDASPDVTPMEEQRDERLAHAGT